MSREPIPLTFTLNGATVRTSVLPWHNAIDALTAQGMNGPRESCGIGMCGCCTIAVDGEVVSGCLMLAANLDGTNVETVEGLAEAGPEAGPEAGLHPVQQAFVECGAFQCGFCTPGWIMMIRQLLADHPQPTDEDIHHYLAGNACRCAAYPDILRAIETLLADDTARSPKGPAL
jgi:aerobic-type carbon monoxide dehydrogenase small subunit (CoxS/CutS family)